VCTLLTSGRETDNPSFRCFLPAGTLSTRKSEKRCLAAVPPPELAEGVGFEPTNATLEEASLPVCMLRASGRAEQRHGWQGTTKNPQILPLRASYERGGFTRSTSELIALFMVDNTGFEPVI
jgi:hypothetical protein